MQCRMLLWAGRVEDVLVMAAAVADYRPATVADGLVVLRARATVWPRQAAMCVP